MIREHWQARLDALQSQGRLPSLVGGVLRDGELVWTGAAGEGPGDPDDRQYRIGSITKTFVAVAVLRLRDAGRLDLDDPVGRFVPETGYASSTIRTLLSHTSGMQSEPAGPWWERSPGGGFPTLVARNDGSGAVAGAGDFFHYSNLGFALLGEAVARIAGSTWWDLVETEVLGPLEMARTTVYPVAPHAQGYSVDHFAGTLTATGVKWPSFCQRRQSAAAVSSASSASGSARPVRSASGTKVAGSTGPTTSSVQRASASTPITRRCARANFGW